MVKKPQTKTKIPGGNRKTTKTTELTVGTSKKCIKQFMTSVPLFTSNFPWSTSCAEHSHTFTSALSMPMSAVRHGTMDNTQNKSHTSIRTLSECECRLGQTTLVRCYFHSMRKFMLRQKLECMQIADYGLLYIYMQTNHNCENVRNFFFSVSCRCGCCCLLYVVFFFRSAKDSIVTTKTLMAF